MERLRPEDDYFFRCESDDSPMHIGALQLFDAPKTPEASGGSFFETFRRHLEARLPETPLARVRCRAPEEFDSDLWCDVAACDLDLHVERVGEPLDRRGLLALVGRVATERLDLARPPFHVHVIEEVEGGGSALFWRVHHAVADGIGFQSLMSLLTDDSADALPRKVAPRADEQPPSDAQWLEDSATRFAREADERERGAAQRERAKAALADFEADPAHARVRGAKLARTVLSSRERHYEILDLPLSRIRAVGRALGGTVNDAFVTLVSGAVRSYFDAAGELPEEPLIAVAARSYRREEHGLFGNRIVNLMPSLATHLRDPALRFAEVRRSMGVEIERSRRLEALLHDYDRPHGARRRREDFEKKMKGGRRILPGQVAVSNVPGPSAPRYLAGRELRASYPAPLLGYGRILNVTCRRYLDALQCGIMSDGAMLKDVETIRAGLYEALEELEACAARL